MSREDKIWAKFVELLSLNLHDGDKTKAEERPATNLLGSIKWHKKVFDQAVAAFPTWEDAHDQTRLRV